MTTSNHGLTQTAIESSFASLLVSLPDQVVTVSFDGNSAQGLKTNTDTDPDLAEYGRMADYKFSVRVKSSDLPTVEVQKLVSIAGTDYLVLNTHLGQSGALLRIDLGDEHA